MAKTTIADVVTPEIFTPYALRETEQKSRLIQSGAITTDDEMNTLLDGGGLTFEMPKYDDLEDDSENIANEADPINHPGGVEDPAPSGIEAGPEIAVRMERNKSWSASKLSKLLSGDDPLSAIGGRVSDWWVRRQQDLFIATMNGVFADNDAAPTGTEHVQGDLTVSLATQNGGTYQEGLTDFGASAFIDATLTMGDSMEDLGMVMMHSVVYARALKNNDIQFETVSNNGEVIQVRTYLGREVIVDDSMPFAAGLYETWMFGAGAIIAGAGNPDMPTEIERIAGAGNGNGQEVLWNRVRWGMHPKGHAYVGATPSGGPTNAVISAAASWERRAKERKQVKIARLITREA